MGKHRPPPPRRIRPTVRIAAAVATMSTVGIIALLVAPVVETTAPRPFPSYTTPEPIRRGGPLGPPVPAAIPTGAAAEPGPAPERGSESRACRCSPRHEPPITDPSLLTEPADPAAPEAPLADPPADPPADDPPPDPPADPPADPADPADPIDPIDPADPPLDPPADPPVDLSDTPEVLPPPDLVDDLVDTGTEENP